MHSDCLDPRSNAVKRVFAVIEGHAGNIDSSGGNTAEHGAGVLSQHPILGEDPWSILRLGSYRSQNREMSGGAVSLIPGMFWGH